MPNDLIVFSDAAKDPLLYLDRARQAVADADTLVKAMDLGRAYDRLEALAFAAKDTRLERAAVECRLRLRMRLGQLSRALDKASNQYALPDDGKTKAEALANVGISTSRAHRYEQLAGGDDPDSQRLAEASSEKYFAACREREEYPTEVDLRDAISPMSVMTPDLPTRQPEPPATVLLPRYPEPPNFIRSTVFHPIHVPNTFEEGVEAAAKLLDREARKETTAKTRSRIRSLAKLVRAIRAQ